jgi:hypothetical protein
MLKRLRNGIEPRAVPVAQSDTGTALDKQSCALAAQAAGRTRYEDAPAL